MTTILKKKALVPASRKITIKIPPQVPVNAPIEIVVSCDSPRGTEEYRQKVALMQQAKNDKQFQADLHEVMRDFRLATTIEEEDENLDRLETPERDRF